MFETIKKLEDEAIEAKRTAIRGLLSQCSEKEQLFFARIFPGEVPAGNLDDAIKLCERTIKARQKNGE